MRKIKEVLRLRFELQLGQREIARACSISQGAVHNYLKKAAAAGIGWPLPEAWDEKRIEEMLFGDRHPIERRQRALPDFPSLHDQFQQHRHLTLQLAWEEYRQVHLEGYGYSRFCELYGRWLRKQDVVLRQNYTPGEKGFVDWAGGTIRAAFTDILHFPARVVIPTPDPLMSARTARSVLEELSGVSERPMIIPMTTTGRVQQRYDHRLRNPVQRTRDMTIATERGVPRSTARGWLGAAPTVVVCLDVADLTEPELRQEVAKLRRRVQKLAALLRLVLALLRTSGFSLRAGRLPDGRAKLRILRAVDRAREYLPLRAVLRFLHMSPSRFHAWRRWQSACALNDQSCPYRKLGQQMANEVRHPSSRDIQRPIFGGECSLARL